MIEINLPEIGDLVGKTDYDKMKLVDQVKALVRINESLADLKELKTALEEAKGYLSVSVIPDKMDEEGISNSSFNKVFSDGRGGRVQLSPQLRCSVKAECGDKVQAWLRANKAADLIKPSVNSSTLKSYIGGRIKENKDYPKDLLNIHLFSQATIVKAK